MKIGKRFLAALVSCVMLLTMTPFLGVLADEPTVALSDIDANTTVGKAVTELVKLGIINGYEDGTFRPDNTITRGEVSKIVITFKKQADVAYDTVPSGFRDVDEANHWAKKYIKLAADQKIVNGYEDGTFLPDNPVKYTEIVKMLVCMMGYGTIAESKMVAGGPWYSGYMALAAEKGMLNSASVNNVEDPASRGTVAILVNNCLGMETASTDSTGNVIINTGSSALEDYQSKSKITGIVTGVQQTGISTGTTGLSAREIKILDGDEEEVYQVSSGYDTMSILGKGITGYVEGPDDDGDYSISSISEYKTQTTVVTPDMIDEVKSTSISYYARQNASKTSKLTFDRNMTVVYNGKYDPNFEVAEFANILSGEIEFICNDGDDDAEVAIVTSYETFVVSSADKTTEPPKVYGKYNAGELTIPFDMNNFYFSLTKSGSNAEPETLIKALTEWDVITVARSKESSSGKAVWKGIITSKKVSGSIQESESATRKKISGTFYDYAKSYENYTGSKPEMALNDYVTIYLDHEGKIAAAASSTTQTNIYLAFMMTAAKQQGVDGVAQVNIYGITGTTKQRTLNLASSVRIDGKNYKDSDEALLALKAASATANTGKAEAGVGGATAYSQLIRYTTNKSGEVDMIDTIAENTSVGDDDLKKYVSFPYSADSATLKFNSGGKFTDANGSTVFSVNSNTKILEVAYDDFTNTEKMRIPSYTAAFTDGASYRVEAYNLSATKAASYVISYVGGDFGTASINDRSPMMIATKVSGVKDGDNIVDKASGYAFPGGTEVNLTSETENTLKNDLLLGDLFRYALSNGKVVEIQKILDFGTNKPAIINPATGADITAPIASAADAQEAANLADAQRSFMIDDVERDESTTLGRFVFGTVLGVDLESKEILITPTTKDDAFGIQEAKDTSFNLSGAKVFLYDYKAANDANKVVVDAQLENIRSYYTLKDAEADVNEATQVMIYHTASNSVKAIIIFKY